PWPARGSDPPRVIGATKVGRAPGKRRGEPCSTGGGMSGGLYRSANASSDGGHGSHGHASGGHVSEDGATLISVNHQDQAKATPSATASPTAASTAAAPPASEGSAARHSAVMAAGSLVSRATGFLRNLVLGAALGGFLVGDAYTAAFQFPGMIYEFLLGCILTSVLVPVLVRRRKADPDGGQAYTQRLLTLAVLALAAAVVIALLCAPLLTMLYANEANADLVRALSYLMLPMIFFTGLSALISAVLN